MGVASRSSASGLTRLGICLHTVIRSRPRLDKELQAYSESLLIVQLLDPSNFQKSRNLGLRLGEGHFATYHSAGRQILVTEHTNPPFGNVLCLASQCWLGLFG